MAILITDLRLNKQTGMEIKWAYNPQFDGPLTVYKRNPNFVVEDTATSQDKTSEITPEGQKVSTGSEVG